MPLDTLQPSSYRFPAEWEPQDAVWLSWPHREDLWQGEIAPLQQTFAKITQGIAQEAQVHINAAANLHDNIRKTLRENHVALERVSLFNHPTNDVWCRDHGGIFIQNTLTGELAITNWEFNAWGEKFAPWNLDNAIPSLMAKALQLPCINSPMILEGGAIEGNGAGLLITTEAVMLNSNRNATWSRQEIEQEIKKNLGIQSIFWLGQGIEGDDTDGHIDDMVRFCREDALIAVREQDSKSPHYRTLEENWEKLADIRTISGQSIERIPLPMPSPLITQDWRLEQLPASYANFLIVNNSVLVPIFQQARNDDKALGILREAFPKHRVMGINARNLVIEGGAIHCITQQQPKAQGH